MQVKSTAECCLQKYSFWGFQNTNGEYKIYNIAGLSPPVKYFTDRSKAILLLWIFYVLFCLVFVMPLCASVYMCLVVTCLERADLLALVCDV